jgi:hypothetical protein
VIVFAPGARGYHLEPRRVFALRQFGERPPLRRRLRQERRRRRQTGLTRLLAGATGRGGQLSVFSDRAASRCASIWPPSVPE